VFLGAQVPISAFFPAAVARPHDGRKNTQQASTKTFASNQITLTLPLQNAESVC
jgi:ABC-type molybdate transport system substrate-binding protein